MPKVISGFILHILLISKALVKQINPRTRQSSCTFLHTFSRPAVVAALGPVEDWMPE